MPHLSIVPEPVYLNPFSILIPDLHLKKSLGQHFLHDENMCRKIVSGLTHTPDMQLLEIGPGGGAITKYMMPWKDVSYKAIEIDAEKVHYLLRTWPELEGKILQQDILKAPAPFEGAFSVIGNFPYNISSPILFRLLEWEPQVSEAIGMFQKEVALRIAAASGNKQYGILSVLVQAFFRVEYLLDVPPGCFTPPPNVMSGVIRLVNAGNPYNITDKKPFFRLVKAAFNQRRKTLRNALRGTLPPLALQDEMMHLRAEQLTVAQFAEMLRKYPL